MERRRLYLYGRKSILNFWDCQRRDLSVYTRGFVFICKLLGGSYYLLHRPVRSIFTDVVNLVHLFGFVSYKTSRKKLLTKDGVPWKD
jgi:hypothetical protein